MTHTDVAADIQCYHCGETCEEVFWQNDKPFCCRGCETVYEILDSNNLCEYYALNERPGIRADLQTANNTYAYLDEPEMRKKLLTFESDSYNSVNFFVPAIHCVSCIWLLENLTRLNAGIVHSTVNFSKKTISIDFNPNIISLGSVASLLALVGDQTQSYLSRMTTCCTVSAPAFRNWITKSKSVCGLT